MKYKQMYETAEQNRLALVYENKRLTKELESTVRERDELKGFIKQVEGKESDVRRENEWLRTTLRMVILDHKKLKHINLKLERDSNSLTKHL